MPPRYWEADAYNYIQTSSHSASPSPVQRFVSQQHHVYGAIHHGRTGGDGDLAGDCEREGETTNDYRLAKQVGSDVTIYVGKRRIPYVQSIDSLSRGSSYFRSVLESRISNSFVQTSEPIVVDCEESVFQHMMTLLRYGTFEALPEISESEMFKLKKELGFYGIHVSDLHLSSRVPHHLNSPTSSSPASSPSARSYGKFATTVASQHIPFAELPDLPVDLGDPSRLVLVSRLDDDPRAMCPCASDDKPSPWALSFQYRHAFCTACGRPALGMAPKFLADMFITAATYYSGFEINQNNWSVGSDSACTLKFLCSKACYSCICSKKTVWAVSAYHSHAFCTRCTKPAEGCILVTLLLILRYGDLHKSPREKKGEFTELPICYREAPNLHPAPDRLRTCKTHLQ